MDMGEFEATLIELKVNKKSVTYLLKDSARKVDITDYLLDRKTQLNCVWLEVQEICLDHFTRLIPDAAV